MLATQLGAFDKWLKTTELSDDRLWKRDLETVSDMEIQLFYARHSQRGIKTLAHEAIDRLQAALILEAVKGQVPDAALRLITHEVPRDRFCVDEFMDGLVKMRPVRRAAVLYALQGKWEPSRVSELTWDEARRMSQVKLDLREILKAQARVRLLRLPYVFWEWVDDRTAAPLMGLKESAEQAFKCTWPSLVTRFESMLWISRRADVSHFLGIAEELATGRL